MIIDLTTATSPLLVLENVCKNPALFFKDVSAVLFHGTSEKLVENLDLEYSQDGLIYASDDPMYAAFLAIINLADNGRAAVSYDDTGKIKLTVNKEFMEGESSFVSGTVFILDKSMFQESDGNHEFVSKEKVIPLGKITITPDLIKKDIQIM